MVSIQVEKSEGLDNNLIMDVTTVGGTAIGQICLNKCKYIRTYTLSFAASKDYTAVLKKITFLSHQSTVIVNIPIIDDTIPQEPDIYFFVEIIFNSSTIARSIITIADDDHGKLRDNSMIAG